MASGTIVYGGALDQQTWKAGLIAEAEVATVTNEFTGSEDNPRAAFALCERTGAKRGSTLTRTFTVLDPNELPKASAIVIGQEADVTLYTQSIVIRYFHLERAIENIVTEQDLVTHDQKQLRVSDMAQQWAYWFEKCRINHLVGNTLANATANVNEDYNLSMGNAVVAMDTAHIYRCRQANGTIPGTDAAVAAATDAILDTRAIDDLVTRASSRSILGYPIAPCDTPFGPLYVLLADPEGYQQIRENGTASDFYDIHKAAIQGGLDLSESSLSTGEGFIYNNTLVLRSDFCPRGITSSAEQANTRVCAFFGANAGAEMYGDGYDSADNKLGYDEFRVMRRLSLMSDTVTGFQRTIVNGVSWASIRVVHYTVS